VNAAVNVDITPVDFGSLLILQKARGCSVAAGAEIPKCRGFQEKIKELTQTLVRNQQQPWGESGGLRLMFWFSEAAWSVEFGANSERRSNSLGFVCPKRRTNTNATNTDTTPNQILQSCSLSLHTRVGTKGFFTK